MNRIYQGKVTAVEISDGKDERGQPKWKKLDDWQSILWQHHQLFQDAVNYYLVALASLGHTPGRVLTQLRERVAAVWDDATKKGQEREGMNAAFRRRFGGEKAPALEEIVEWFQRPLIDDGVPMSTAEKAGEFLLHRLGGESAIQQGGRVFWPMFCNPDSTPTFSLVKERLARSADEKMLAEKLYADLDDNAIKQVAESIHLGSVVNLEPGAILKDEEAKERLKMAATELGRAELHAMIDDLNLPLEIPKNRGGKINMDRVNACLLFKYLPSADTKAIFRDTFAAPKQAKPGAKKSRKATEKKTRDEDFIVDGDDPIRLSRGTRGRVFPAFTNLKFWATEPSRPVQWSEFDIAAFKEALKVLNQFHQNVARRAEKLVQLRGRLEWMDGTSTDKSFLEANEPEPPVFKNKRGHQDPRIQRLREIVDKELAEEYRLTEGRSTSYGLRRRTMKGWGDVKRKWQSIVKAGDNFSAAKQEKLQQALNALRKKKREQIGSHRLFEALIANDQSWAIWREPTEREQDEIADNRWAGDPLDTFRLYCETKEAFDELSDTNRRPLNFTPANAKYSRRLFIFSDVCSFPGPEFRHDPDELAVTVPLAVANSDGRFQRHRARLSYRAPRLLRDQLRGIDGKLGKAWLQPMIAALGLSEGVAEEQDISDAAVQLMPDFPRDRGQRFLLNFPLDLSPVALWRRVYELRNQSEFFATRFAKIDKKKDKPLHGGIWEANLRTFWEGSSPKKRDTLFWPSDEPALPEWCPHRWWEKLSSFRVLGADLGTRHGASVALVEASALSREETPDECSRFIGEANGRKWHARFRTGKILRLAGEDAAVFRHRTKQDLANHSKSETNRPDIDLREELHGSRGRLADRPECEETLRTLRQFGQLELVPEECRGCNDDATLREAAAILRPLLSFPEQNDKLLIAIRRTQGLIADLISMHWRLVNPEEPEQKTKALAEIQEQERYPEWHEMAHADQPHADLTAKMHAEIASLRRQVQEQLLALTRRILPLRGRDWERKPYSTEGRFKDCHELRQTMPESDDVNKEEEDSSVKLRGQRGLSMARIEQLGELRRRWQSLNQSLRRQIGQRPLTAAEMRDQLIPDPCPDILKRLGAIREQRVNQIAHMIMAEALGVRTTKHAQPGEDRIRRRAADVHGEYERFRPPVDFIVLEDLSRYLSNQGRAKSENSRLMEWCHRQVNAKVKELAEPFGIPVLETAAAWSSRFCSLSGIAGFRAVEVAPADATEFKWRKLLEEYDEAHEKRAKEGASKESKTSIEARGAHHLFDLLEQINVGREGKYVRTLLAPQPGGPIFVPAYQLHRIPDSQQADINAAINLAFRAIAQPSCAQIHLRLRSERVPAKNKNEHDRFFAREERRFGKGVGIEIVSENGSLPKDRNPNFFFDPHHVATEDRAKLIDGVSDHEADYAPYAPLWGKVNAAAFQWWRCRQFNRHRVEDWKKEAKTA